MKTSILKTYLFLAGPLLCVILTALSAYSGQGGVEETIKNANTPLNDEKKVDSAHMMPDNIVMAIMKYQGGIFWTETRKDKMERFTCSNCHNNKKVTVNKAAEIAHGEPGFPVQYFF
jgi:hypothetical protein